MGARYQRCVECVNALSNLSTRCKVAVVTTAAAGRTSRGRRRARPSGDDRELAILATAERLLEERPLTDISVDDLAKGAGLSRPTFYFYFSSKDAVLLTLLDRVIVRRTPRWKRRGATPADPRRMWRTGINVFFSRRSARTGRWPGPERKPLATSSEVRACVVGVHAEVDRPDGGHDRRRAARGAAPETIPAADLATSLNLMNERTMMAALSAETARRSTRTGVLDTLVHIWVTSIYGEARSPAFTSLVTPACEHMFVRCDASILHADLDSFYASVEQRDDPTLRGRPVIVGGGVVLAASYEAKAYGVRTAMGGAQARRLCPHAVVVPPRMTAYSRASDAVFEVFRDCTPIVEPISVDEAFLDVGGLRRVSGTPVQIAERLRADVRDRVGLPITVGIARTKFLAKVASQEAKPDGLLLVPPDQELAFLHPLPVRRLWGVGAVTADKLHAHGIVDRRRRRRAQRVDAGLAAGRCDGPPTVCAVPQCRPPPGDHRCASPVGGSPASAGPRRQHACRPPRSTRWWST